MSNSDQTPSQKPRVSVLMPVYNGQSELVATIASVLAQSMSDWEYVAVDDGSTDNTPRILDRYAAQDSRFVVLHTPNQGITKALNAGLKKVSGEFVARLDCGDLCAPNRFERQMEFLETHPAVVAVGSYAFRISPEGWPVDVYTPPLDHEDIDRRHIEGVGGGIVHVAAMLRTEVLQRVGGYCEHFRYAQDTDLWLRLAEIGQLANIPENLQTYRLDFTGISATKRETQRAFSLQAVARARDRRGMPPLSEEASLNIKINELDLMENWTRLAYAHGNYHTAMHYAFRLLRKRPSRQIVSMYVRSIMKCIC